MGFGTGFRRSKSKKLIAGVFEQQVRMVGLLDHQQKIDRLFGVPNGMTAMTSSVADLTEIGMLPLKKWSNNSSLIPNYVFVTDHPHRAVGLEDVITTGESTRRAAYNVNQQQYNVTDIIALIVRNGAEWEQLTRRTNARVHALFTSVRLAEVLVAENRISEENLRWVENDFYKVY